MKTINKAAATILTIGVLGAASFASDEAQASVTCGAGSCNNYGYIFSTQASSSSCTTGCSEPQYHSSISWTMSFQANLYAEILNLHYSYVPYPGFPNGFGYSFLVSVYCPATGYNTANFPGPYYGSAGPQYAVCPGFAFAQDGFTEVTAIAP